MITKYTDIPDVLLIEPTKFGDNRGFFSETFNKSKFVDFGLNLDFVQDNHSLSESRGTVRGLHFQTPPYAQDKLVRVVRGSILDVAVDLRKSSATYGRHVAVEISASNWRQILVPKGFAHGFVTLEDETEVVYKVTNFYSQEHDFGIYWDDPDLAIDWGVTVGNAIVSDKDQRQPRLADIVSPF